MFAEVDGRELLLDLYLPWASKPPPLIVYVHGGAWRTVSKDSMPLTALLGEGYAIASVDYRLTPEAPFPAQVHDIKAAMRFLRGNQDRYPYDGRRVAIAGSSAGGHLARISHQHLAIRGTAVVNPATGLSERRSASRLAVLPHLLCFGRPDSVLRDRSRGFPGCVAVVPRSVHTPPLSIPSQPASALCRMTCTP